MGICSRRNNTVTKDNLLLQLEQERAGNSLKLSFTQIGAHTDGESRSIRLVELRKRAKFDRKPLFTRNGPITDDFEKEAEVAKSHLKALLS